MTGPVYISRLKVTKDDLQGRLLQLAALFLAIFALTLTLSPAARARSWGAEYHWAHWLAFGVWVLAFYLIYRQSQTYTPTIDPLLIPLAALLTGWGTLSIWRLTGSLGLRQTVWIIIAAAIFILGLRLKDDLALLRRYKYLWLFSGLGLTALTLIFGTNPLGYGPQLWLGCCGIYMQPSEPLKLLLIVFLAAYLADRQPFAPSLLPLLAPTAIMAGLVLLLLLVQRDLGTASIFMFIYTGVLYAATGKRRILLFALIVLVIAGLSGYLLFDLIQIRVDAWLNPWLDPSGRSYQIVQSLIAVASGGMIGRGPGLGNPGLVPIAHSDFIFSTIAEENGLVGTIALIILLATLTLRGLRISLHAENRYHRFLAIGLTTYLAGQAILIIGGNIRLLPLTGVTLPFVSYGGSSLVTSFLALLLLAKISLQQTSNSTSKAETKPVKHLSGLLLAGFAAVGLINGWWAFYRGPDLLTRTDNARRSIADRFVPRGAILDRNGESLTITVGSPTNFNRVYLYPAMAPILGYTHPVYGQAGVEASLDPILRGFENQSAWDLWLNHLLYGQPPPGLDVRLTLDLELQNQGQTLLGDLPGAIVILNAESGEVLGMVSSPSFDPNRLDETWETLVAQENAPLVNRATQALYQPGPALGPFLLAASGNRGEIAPELADKAYIFGEIAIPCSVNLTDYSWEGAISAGCPSPLEQIGLSLGGSRLLDLFESLGFYSSPDLHLASDTSAKPATIATPGAEAVGQGVLRISPLQLALAAASLSNQGKIPAPQILLEVEDPDGGWDVYPLLGETQSPFIATVANRVAMDLAGENKFFWHTLALAYNGPNQPLTWFVGGTLPDTEQPLVVVVLLESNNPGIAQFIGEQLLTMP